VFPQTPPAWGFADLHTHPASHLGFGADAHGNYGIIWGKPGMDANSSDVTADLPNCNQSSTVVFPGPASVLTLLLNNLADPSNSCPTWWELVLNPPPFWSPVTPVAPFTSTHAPPFMDYVQYFERKSVIQTFDQSMNTVHMHAGAPGFQNWPSPILVEHQQMHISALKHAYLGGLRLLFASATDNQVLSTLWASVGYNSSLNPSPPAPAAGFDLNSAIKQIQFIQSLVAANGSFMQIVKSPEEARSAIAANKIAVVLSVEFDALSLSDIQTLVSTYGVRHVIPIHLSNHPVFGGTAIYADLWNGNNYFLTGSFYKSSFDPTISFHLGVPKTLQACFPGFVLANPISADQFNALGYSDAQGDGNKNALGLTQQAFFQLMQMGLLLDVAHMGEQSTEDAISLAEQFGYPIMDSHTGIRQWGTYNGSGASARNERAIRPDHLLRLGNLGGVLGLGTAWDPTTSDPVASFLDTFRQGQFLMGGRGIAFGTDMNGLQQEIPGNQDGVATGMFAQDISYPVTIASNSAPAALGLMPLAAYTAGNKVYDLQTDGLANYAMMPDFIQALANQDSPGAPAAQELFRSAEDVIEMWEQVEQITPTLTPPAQKTCQQPQEQQCVAVAQSELGACLKEHISAEYGNSACLNIYGNAIAACDAKYCKAVTPPGTVAITESVRPVSDPGRFALVIDPGVSGGTVILKNVGDQAQTRAVPLSDGTHMVAEQGAANTSPGNYSTVFGGDCDSKGSVQIVAGIAKACTITNNGFPTLTISLAIEPLSYTPDRFTILVDGAVQAAGVWGFNQTRQLTSLSTATHTITIAASGSTSLVNYGIGFSGDCQRSTADSATLTITAGDAKTCSISAVRVTCPAGQKLCGDAHGFPPLCVPQFGTCDALCPFSTKTHTLGTFCGVSPDGQAECAYPPEMCVK
jgi:microsomal dipeptidase-like Zn-dependent dipeptidase